MSIKTHISCGEGHDGGGALVVEEVVGDGGEGVGVGGRGGQGVAPVGGPQEGGHPVAHNVKHKLGSK